jgi:hypothetical protein
MQDYVYDEDGFCAESGKFRSEADFQRRLKSLVDAGLLRPVLIEGEAGFELTDLGWSANSTSH